MEKFNFELFSLWNHPTCPIFSYLYPVIIKNNKGTQIYYRRRIFKLSIFLKRRYVHETSKKKKKKKGNLFPHFRLIFSLEENNISCQNFSSLFEEKVKTRCEFSNSIFSKEFRAKKKIIFNVFWLKFTREICLLSLRYSKDMVIYALPSLLSWNSLSRTFSKYIQISQVPRAFLSKQNFESKIRKIYGI